MRQNSEKDSKAKIQFLKHFLKEGVFDGFTFRDVI